MKNILTFLLLGLVLSMTTVSALDPLLPGDEGYERYGPGAVEVKPIPIEVPPNHGNDLLPFCGPNDIECPKVDLVFVIDSTGSMYDEIRTVKETLYQLIDTIKQENIKDFRVGIVTYRDYKPEEQEYLIKDKQLTTNIRSVLSFIEGIEAYGGGDYEEAVEAGLQDAIHKMKWRDDATKIMILIGDAPSRDYYFQPSYHGNEPENTDNILKYTLKQAAEDARKKEIKIFTVSASGMNDRGIAQWKMLADFTGGDYQRLTYTRTDIDEYYKEMPIGYKEEARASRDYDAITNTILSNNIASITKKSLAKSITGHTVYKPQEPNNILDFFRTIFQKIKFWN